jgi:hypothetical protein
VCDVGESGTTSNPNVGDKLRRYIDAVGVIRSVDAPTDSHAKNAKGAKNCHEENSGFAIR